MKNSNLLSTDLQPSQYCSDDEYYAARYDARVNLGWFAVGSGHLGRFGPTVSFGGALMRVKIPQVGRVGRGGIRGAVREYSSASRRRFMELFCSVQLPAMLRSWNGRLSWSDDCLPITGLEVKRCLHQLQVEMRKYFPDFCIIWRCELELRKMGDFSGTWQPHVHFVVASHGEGCEADKYELDLARVRSCSGAVVAEHEPGCSYRAFCEWLPVAWHRIIGSSDPQNLVMGRGWHLQPSYGTPRALAWYVSKYVTKVADGAALQSFAWSGRWWGVFNRSRLPVAQSYEVPLTEYEAIQLNRLGRAWLRRWPSARHFARKVAGFCGHVGFGALGLPADVAVRMICHAVDLAAASGLDKQSISGRRYQPGSLDRAFRFADWYELFCCG